MTGVPGLTFTAIPVKGKAPPYSPHRHDPHIGDNIGVQVTDTTSGKTLFYAPGLGDRKAADMGHLPQSGENG